MAVSYYGDYPENHTKVIIPFNTFSSDDPSVSVTVTNLVNTDVHIHKDAGVAPRNNAAGITMSVNHDGITGNHLLTIDTSDDTVAGFYVTGKEYQVRIEGATVDAGAINAFVGSFSIERAGGTIALLKLIQVATITNAQGADVATDVKAMIDGNNRVDVGSWLGQAVTLSTGNKPDVNVNEISDSSAAANRLEASAETIIEDTVDTGYSETTTTLKGGGTATLDATDDHYNGRLILFVSGVLQNQATSISDYNGTTKIFTVVALTEAASDGDGFIIV